MKLFSGPQVLDVPLDWQFAEHAHPGVEVVGVLQGQVELGAADLSWKVSKGEVLAVPPHLRHSWSSNAAAKLTVLHVFRFPPGLTDRLLPGCKPRLLSVAGPQFAEYETLFSRLVAISDEATPQLTRLLRAYLEALLLSWLEGKRGQDPTWVAMYEVAAYMQAHMMHALTIAGVARHFSLSEVTLRRRFREACGMSPKHYLLELRLSHAQDLLTTTNLSMQEIALQMGFFDLAHFSSTFRKHYGLSPSAWRGSNHG